jgi:ribonuclease P/MRP protein subunit POP1
MSKSRKSLMSRAFQQVPRHMRRRGASHDVRKVPKRLRARAKREMKLDNTPTVTRKTRPISRKLRLRYETAKLLKKLNLKAKHNKPGYNAKGKRDTKDPDPEKHVDVSRIPRIKKNQLARPPTATVKYKKRQVNKTWLPTHLWHTKRAHMTRPTQPLWGMAVPLSPTEKVYRASHRAAGARGAVAWDTSYVATVGCQGTEHTLGNMLALLGFEEAGGARGRRYRNGTRWGDGWVREVEGNTFTAPVKVVWMVKETPAESDTRTTQDKAEMMNTDNEETKRKKVKLDRKLLIRIHPYAFNQFWTELLKAAKMQKPQVLVEDLRFEIGSIEVTGPGSTEALLGILKPRHEPKENSVEQVWTSLAGLNNPASLPDKVLLAFDIIDPRLSHPPKQINLPTTASEPNTLNELIVTWSPDTHQPTPKLFHYKSRWLAGSHLPSQKSINRRRAAGPGNPITPTDKDPSIPILLLASRPTTSEANAQGTWTLLLPWLCVDAVWRSLMYYPLSTGGTPRFGGLQQIQQLAFERLAPWYPGDYPGTAAGRAWENSESEKRFDEWVRRPPGRRLAWDMVELGLGRRGEAGRGWGCDWEYLFKDTEPVAAEDCVDIEMVGADAEKQPVRPRRTSKEKKKNAKPEPDRRRRNTSSPESDAEPETQELEPPIESIQLTPSEAASIFTFRSTSKLPITPALATVRIRLLTKGSPKPAARIYRLPFNTQSKAPSQPATTQASTHPESNHTSSTDSAPPPGQGTAPIQPSSSNATSSLTLREKWLSLLPPTFHISPHLPKTSKPRMNHRGLPVKEINQSYDPPDHINVLPRNAPQSIIDEFGAKQLSEEDIKQRQREDLMRELMKNDVGPGEKWDVDKGLVECPDPGDLIGFVTSGGFNLAEGRGTAVGGVWAPRVLKGWEDDGASDGKVGSDKEMKEMRKRRERERYLCVVRNAGESVGRLGVWEVC